MCVSVWIYVRVYVYVHGLVCLCVYVCVYLEDRQKGNERKTVPPMGEEFRGKWRHVYVWLTPLAVHLKLPQ